MAPAQHVGQMCADGEERIQRRHRILEDHRDACAAVGVHRGLVEREQVDAVEQDLATHPRQVRRQQAHETGREARLAAARLADDAENAALADVEVDAAQDMRRTARGRCLERQLPDRHQWSDHFQRSCRMRGSTASRSASPNSVKPSVAMASATLDTTTGTQLSDRNW
jgi:hypothetical protein